ncbi:hypothetical protein H4R99_007061 [Coemansia sp. RSA 1722]|nr:hypothetical protein H4R99_007061 [Coemansia sp. RSA 1722]KAJ2639485.1 hypothetical protein GGF40_000843 [Coemansia sp. RSA 1286]
MARSSRTHKQVNYTEDRGDDTEESEFELSEEEEVFQPVVKSAARAPRQKGAAKRSSPPSRPAPKKQERTPAAPKPVVNQERTPEAPKHVELEREDTLIIETSFSSESNQEPEKLIKPSNKVTANAAPSRSDSPLSSIAKSDLSSLSSEQDYSWDEDDKSMRSVTSSKKRIRDYDDSEDEKQQRKGKARNDDDYVSDNVSEDDCDSESGFGGNDVAVEIITTKQHTKSAKSENSTTSTKQKASSTSKTKPKNLEKPSAKTPSLAKTKQAQTPTTKPSFSSKTPSLISQPSSTRSSLSTLGSSLSTLGSSKQQRNSSLGALLSSPKSPVIKRPVLSSAGSSPSLKSMTSLSSTLSISPSKTARSIGRVSGPASLRGGRANTSLKSLLSGSTAPRAGLSRRTLLHKKE